MFLTTLLSTSKIFSIIVNANFEVFGAVFKVDTPSWSWCSVQIVIFVATKNKTKTNNYYLKVKLSLSVVSYCKLLSVCDCGRNQIAIALHFSLLRKMQRLSVCRMCKCKRCSAEPESAKIESNTQYGCQKNLHLWIVHLSVSDFIESKIAWS